MIQEFKDFIAKGNVMDMAVGIIVGAAFTAIVSSMVADLINPIVGLFTGGVDFTTTMPSCREMSRRMRRLNKRGRLGPLSLPMGRF